MRRAMTERRSAIPESERLAMSELIASAATDALRDRDLVMVFLSFGSEVATDPIVDSLASGGHRLCVPHIDGLALVPASYTPGDPMRNGVLGIREPAGVSPVGVSEIDAVIVPGLAFDARGYRIGYGGGYYDRLLGEIRSDALGAGVCFHQQVVDEVPHGEGDRPVVKVITDTGTIDCR